MQGSEAAITLEYESISLRNSDEQTGIARRPQVFSVSSASHPYHLPAPWLRCVITAPGPPLDTWLQSHTGRTTQCQKLYTDHTMKSSVIPFGD